MHTTSSTPILLFLCAAVLLLGSTAPAIAQPASPAPIPHIIQLDRAAMEPTDVFKGPPETHTMRSGYMVLAPTKSVGKHSTRMNEEAVLVLAGSGEMRISGGPTLKLKPYCVAYCPPLTEHDVVNTGTDTLRYIWLVARAQP